MQVGVLFSSGENMFCMECTVGGTQTCHFWERLFSTWAGKVNQGLIPSPVPWKGRSWSCSWSSCTWTATGHGWDPLTMRRWHPAPSCISLTHPGVASSCQLPPPQQCYGNPMLTHSVLSALYPTATPSFPCFPAQGTLAESLQSSLLSPHLSPFPPQHTLA